MKRPDTEHRDRRLGLALRELEVPEHREAFFEDLERRLSEPMRRRRGFLHNRPTRALALAGAACLAALLVVTIGWPRLRGETGVASAARIVTRLSHTLAEARTVRGRLVYRALDVRSGETVVTRQSFAEDARGDLRLIDLAGAGDLAYTASNATERAVTTSASLGTGRFFAERTGLAPGPPDPGPTSSILDRELGAVVRGLATAHDPRVEDVSFDGRPAWRLSSALQPNTIFPDADHLDVVVDRRSGFPVRVLTTLRGAFRSELVVRNLVVNEPVSARELDVRFPAHAEVLRTNEGFVRVGADPAAAGRIARYRPLVPRDVPAGFRLTTVAVARNAAATGPGGSNPPSRDVISLSYRRGLDQFVVTSRLRGGGSWRDPFATEGIQLAGRPVEVGGALARTSSRLVMDPRTVPHLWAVTDRLVVTVAGDLDRTQLLSVARSLR